jgi:formyl-CoA transferase
MAIFTRHGVPAGRSTPPSCSTTRKQANGLTVDVEHAILGHCMVGPAFQLSDTPLAAQGASPTLGAHTDEVLVEAGLDEAAIAALRAKGVVGG